MKKSIKAIICAVFILGYLHPAVSSGDDEAAGRMRLVFIGDIMAHETQLEAGYSGSSYDFSPQFHRITPLFYDALVVGNLETVFAGERAKYTGYPEFNTPDVLADNLADAGVGLVTLANNHILDRGEKGAARTLDVLNGAGLLWTGIAESEAGAGTPLVVERDGFRIAFLNFTYGSNNPLPGKTGSARSDDILLNVISREAVSDGLAKARAQSPDLTIACFHWGDEYVFEPTRRDMSIAELCLENGADMVIGTHPHVLQPIEIRSPDESAKLVAWSLGNFVSYQRTLPRERSVVLAVDVEKTEGGGTAIERVSVAPTWVSARHTGGRRRIEVVYAGTGGPFNHAGLPAMELNKARAAGKLVMEFLGAKGEPDENGFYTLWDTSSPDILPLPARRSPQ